MAEFTFDIAGFAGGLDAAKAAVLDGAADGLTDLAERILTAAKAAAPKDSGELVDSGTTAVDREGLEAAIGFGSGGSAVNAIVQHERMDYAHDDGGPKYLEIPFVAVGSGSFANVVGGAIRSKL